MSQNLDKTVSANSKGIIISFRDVNKHKFVGYENPQVKAIQINGHSRYQVFEKPVFNKTQQRIYAETLYGLNVYEPKQLSSMPKEKKQEIIVRYTKVQRVLNTWKQDLVNKGVDDFLKALFPHSKIVQAMCQTKIHTYDHQDRYTFKELGLTQEKIAEKLVSVNLLPSNFFELV